MEWLTGTLMTLAAVSIICTLLELLLPEGSLKTTAQLALGLFLLLTIASPLVGLVKQMDYTKSVFSGSISEKTYSATPIPYEEIVQGVYDRFLGNK